MSAAEPFDILGFILGPEIAKAERIDALAEIACRETLTNEVAPLVGASPDDVWSALSGLPENLKSMLNSPQGWCVLATIVPFILDVAAQCDFAPTVH